VSKAKKGKEAQCRRVGVLVAVGKKGEELPRKKLFRKGALRGIGSP